MGSPYLSPYEDPTEHAHISALIRDHSSNRQDVRRAMLRSVDLGRVETVLDLGCGFGFWAEELAGRVSPTACFIGIDACDANERSYLRSLETTGRRARFICADLDSDLPFDDKSFDLVIATYSLYFFVDIIPEVARVLKPEGRFLAVTHSEGSFAGLLGAMGLRGEDSPLIRLVHEFSAENGEALLAGSFPCVQRVDYRNALVFGTEDVADFLAYVHFKLPWLRRGESHAGDLPEALARRASDSLRRRGRVIVQKDDALFICGGRNAR